ncbi:MAG: S-layer protein domain-containing protein [Methanosarcinales archaeon]|nr:hypothetical protein [ANME-2 cluster archaeon]MDW7775028.1 S-layer protein domain-containing protein [Methanosarcinales archaeon]
MDHKKYFVILLILMYLTAPVFASQNLEKKDVRDGSSWNIGSGYYIMVEGVDYVEEQAFVSIWKDGEMLNENLLQAGKKFEYYDSTSSLIVSLKLGSVFRGTSGSVCHFTDIYLRYGEPSSTVTTKPTATKTAVPTDTPSPLSTREVDFGEGAIIPGLSAPLVMAIMILSAVILKKQRKE